MNCLQIMTKRLLSEDVHHSLLNYEGLLAFTNLSSFEAKSISSSSNETGSNIRHQIVKLGVWDGQSGQDKPNIKDLLLDENEQISVAAIELMNNISTDGIIQENIVNGKCSLELKIFAQKLK